MSLNQIAAELKMLHPDAVVFEMDITNHDQAVVDFLRVYPRIRLNGLNPGNDSLTIFSRERRWTVPIEQLGPVIITEDVV